MEKYLLFQEVALLSIRAYLEINLMALFEATDLKSNLYVTLFVEKTGNVFFCSQTLGVKWTDIEHRSFTKQLYWTQAKEVHET